MKIKKTVTMLLLSLLVEMSQMSQFTCACVREIREKKGDKDEES